ncbi:hypothetical protein [Kitasatospora purpeofusca]|uniref:hypothetical protein n=1 Tax=Kitasatospora purpeofusca TaxID=67352 RepID=UPI00381A33DD
MRLHLVYAEYESGEPPFVWIDGTRRSPEEKRRAIRLISDLSRQGKHRRSESGLVVRGRDWLLIQTTAGLTHDDGGPQGAVVVLRGPVTDTVGDVDGQLAEVLQEGRITLDPERFGAVLGRSAGPRKSRVTKVMKRCGEALRGQRQHEEQVDPLGIHVPEKLAERLLTVTLDDYVMVSDRNPERLRDPRITIVPVPLFGRWKAFPELRESVLYPDHAYVRDRDSGQRYVAVDSAVQATALRKCRLAMKVSKELGAKSLRVTDFRTDSGNFGIDNEFTANAQAGQVKEPRSGAGGEASNAALSAEERSSLHLTAHLLHDLKVIVEAEGNWPGHAPSISAALGVLEGYDPSDVEDLRIFIEQRDGEYNVSTSISLRINLLSELNRTFDLFYQTAAGLEAALGRKRVKAETSLANTFKIQYQRIRMVSLSLRIEF